MQQVSTLYDINIVRGKGTRFYTNYNQCCRKICPEEVKQYVGRSKEFHHQVLTQSLRECPRSVMV